MDKWIKLLSVLLGVQLLLALVVNLSGEEQGAFQAKEKLLSFDEQVVDGLQIAADGHALVLRKRDGRWLLPDNGDFPAEQASVKRLLDSLAGLRQGWPVATTSAAVRRFKVADDEFQTRITLLQEDQTLARLFLGTSPGFRKVHVRPADEDAVFAVAFNSWEASAEADDWIDKEILNLDPDGVRQVELPGVVLQRQEDGLQVTELGDQERTNGEEADSLLSKLTGLRVQSLLGTRAEPAYRLDTPDLEIELEREQGEPLVYRFSKPEAESYYVLKRSDLDYYFKVPEFSVKPILEMDRQMLVLSESKEPTEETTTAEAIPTDTQKQAD
jgi:hypothetical protein